MKGTDVVSFVVIGLLIGIAVILWLIGRIFDYVEHEPKPIDKNQQISTLINFIEDARKELEIKEGDSSAGVKFEEAFTELSKKYCFTIKKKG